MKKIVFLSLLFFMALAGRAQEEAPYPQDVMETLMYAYLSADDPTSPTVDILNKPSGATVMTLSPDDIYIFVLATPQDGWWKIIELWTAEGEEPVSMTGSDTGEYWIHYLNLGIGTRNYGEECLTLRAAPDEEADIVYSFTKELELMPLEIQGDWVKVKVDGYDIVGWIEAEWLCSNPLTNCC